MLSWIVSSFVMILLVMALRAVIKDRVGPRLRYALWLLVLVRLLLPVDLGSTGLSVLNVVERAGRQSQFQTVLTDPVLGYVGGETPDLAIPDTPGMTPEEHRDAQRDWQAQMDAYREETGGRPVRLSDLLLVLWAVGAAVTAAILLSVNLRFYVNLKRRGKLVGKFRGLPVYVAENMVSPCLAGLLHPAVFITPELARSEVVRTHIMAHEYTHYRQKDHIWAALRSLCLVLHWYDPLVWWAAAASRRDCELSCDAGAVELLGEQARASYGRTLVSMVSPAAARVEVLRCATTMAGGKSAVKERVTLLIEDPRTRAATFCAVAALALVIAVCTFTGPARAAGTTEGGTQTGGQTDEPAAPVYQFDVMTAKETFVNEDGIELAWYEFTFPSMEVANADSLTEQARTSAEQIPEAFNAEMRARLEEAVPAASGYEDYARDMLADSGEDCRKALPLYQRVSPSVSVQGQIVSVLSLWEDYSGGPHPNYGYGGDLFDLSTGQFLSAADIADDPDAFDAGVAELLIAYAEGRSESGQEFGAEAWEDWRDTVRAWGSTGAVWFGQEGLWVSYDPYALGPYAMGGVELFASYEDIWGLLGESGRAKLGLDEDYLARHEVRRAMLEAYTDILERAFSGEQSEWDYYDPQQTDPQELAKNEFAVYDVDGDGLDELIVNYNDTYMAGMNVTIYGYDPAAGEIHQELRDFCAAGFYDNGYAVVDASHNHGRNALDGDWWPYSLYRYDAETDTYQLLAIVDAWDRAQQETYGDQRFPADADADGDGIVYYAEDGWEYADPMDGAAYEAWVDAWRAGAEEIEIPWQPLTWDDIHDLK